MVAVSSVSEFSTSQYSISRFHWSRSLGYKDEMEKPSHTEMVTVQATAGLLAGACSSIITTPVDTVKTRLQVRLFYTEVGEDQFLGQVFYLQIDRYYVDTAAVENSVLFLAHSVDMFLW